MRCLVLALALGACGRGDGPDSGPVDSDSDVDAPDTDAPPAVWSWCPGVDAYAGDPAWEARLHSTGALWCAMGSESRALVDEPARKAQIVVRAGDFALPHVDGTEDALTLPLCTRFADGGHVDLSGAGSVSARSEAYLDAGTQWVWQHTQPMERDGQPWALQMRLSTVSATADPPTVSMTDAAQAPWGGDFISMSLYEGAYQADGYEFVACDYSNPRRVVTTHIEFQGGSVDLVLHIGESVESTEPAMFVRAEGTLDGTQFAQTDYWHLLYNPEHHHGRRHHAVLFNSPIGSACGLMASNVTSTDPDSGGETATLQTVDCDLEPIEAREVTAQATDTVTR